MSAEGNGERNNRHACAACKYQRRKCKEKECPLYTYFPIDRTEEFQAAHKVFGISNMTKMIKDLPVQDKAKVVDSFVWEASAWKQDPVNGPLGLYRRVQQENELLKNQLNQRNQQAQQQTLPYPVPLPAEGVNGAGIGPTIGYSKENMLQFGVPITSPAFMGPVPVTLNGFPSLIHQTRESISQGIPQQGNGSQIRVGHGGPMSQIPYIAPTITQEQQIRADMLHNNGLANYQVRPIRSVPTTRNPNSMHAQQIHEVDFHEQDFATAPNMVGEDISYSSYVGHQSYNIRQGN